MKFNAFWKQSRLPGSKVFANVTIVGEPGHVKTLLSFLKCVESLGNVGSSRTLTLWVDGDGAGRISVKVAEIDDEDIPSPSLGLSGDDLHFDLD